MLVGAVEHFYIPFVLHRTPTLVELHHKTHRPTVTVQLLTHVFRFHLLWVYPLSVYVTGHRPMETFRFNDADGIRRGEGLRRTRYHPTV